MSDARQTNLQERVVRITYLFNAQAVTITYHKLGEATRLRNHRCPFKERGRQTILLKRVSVPVVSRS